MGKKQLTAAQKKAIAAAEKKARAKVAAVLTPAATPVAAVTHIDPKTVIAV